MFLQYWKMYLAFVALFLGMRVFLKKKKKQNTLEQ